MELKRSSPSAGTIIDNDVDIINIAKQYEENGVSCISILTDEKYFKGSINDLIEVKKQLAMYCPIAKVIRNSGTTINENWTKIN